MEKLRAKQMIELTEQAPLTDLVPELVQLVLERVEIQKFNELTFYFMDGLQVSISLEQ